MIAAAMAGVGLSIIGSARPRNATTSGVRSRACRARLASDPTAGIVAMVRASTRGVSSLSLLEEGGFLYDSDTYNDELPYYVSVGAKPHLVVPYGLSTNDVKQASGILGTADDFFQFLRDAFHMLSVEGAQTPRMMSVSMHMRILGHPARAAGLARFLDHVSRRRTDIAPHWLAHHPPQG